jgi:hypothetical protein
VDECKPLACGIFQADNVAPEDVEVLVETFDGQSIDFFGALRARVYDDKAGRSSLKPAKLRV